MKSSKWAGLIGLMLLTGCAQSVGTAQPFSVQSQANVYGWISVEGYHPPVSTYLEVEMCQTFENQCFTVASQQYQGVQLPVQYSFLIAPIQAGKGEMKVIGKLYSQGQIIAKNEQKYIFREGSQKVDLRLFPIEIETKK
ncbi:YscW family type III secretion system pilotin [Vibrio parahaemolyticus]|uniref:YscW family type III secretion system pilotin n=1 Tax=Vibrio parahaemolyticus TaxID=670 RepID=UPI0004A46B91|nr:YscW family type III secretion system pilotin [Vibrio parahaemolyticus]EGQ8143649.1 type III secretion system chaperone YscW [Vibrio parahaemolyticus]EGQ8338311.1 type III secretion system chaperone YscW [Vibrio parahaemolyticus]EGQ8370136.1 type III secretion system chaperone YscW [Vibrio parahaemolyticus]EGQ8724376.1 type III secretion system chaperone YscW [Vibrio parahaemolyticus]EGQ8763625.1 type III secretion system chaperone YscW [Vibrio parahaemolyticus]